MTAHRVSRLKPRPKISRQIRLKPRRITFLKKRHRGTSSNNPNLTTQVEAISNLLSLVKGLPYAGIDASVAPLGSAPPLTASFESLGLGRFPKIGPAPNKTALKRIAAK